MIEKNTSFSFNLVQEEVSCAYLYPDSINRAYVSILCKTQFLLYRLFTENISRSVLVYHFSILVEAKLGKK